MLKKLIIIIALSCLLLPVFSVMAEDKKPVKFQPQVSIPGSAEFQKNADAKKVDTGTLGRYIRDIYKYAIGVVGILSAVVMMWGGVRWLTAGGNSSAIEDAKGWITASLTGLILVLASYSILHYVNPKLTAFERLDIQAPEEIPRSVSDVNRTSGLSCIDTNTNQPGRTNSQGECIPSPTSGGASSTTIIEHNISPVRMIWCINQIDSSSSRCNEMQEAFCDTSHFKTEIDCMKTCGSPCKP